MQVKHVSAHPYRTSSGFFTKGERLYVRDGKDKIVETIDVINVDKYENYDIARVKTTKV